MASASVMVPGAPPDFGNLSLFICRLFVGGNFKMAHILYHPEAFDRRLIAQIFSNCAVDIPMEINDITKLKTIPRYKQNKTANHILQLYLYFLRPDQLIQDIKRKTKVFTIYRVVIFNTDQSRDNDHELFKYLYVLAHSYSRFLILVHNPVDDSIRSYVFQHRRGLIRLDNRISNSPKELFNDIYGEKHFPQILGFQYEDVYCTGSKRIDYRNITLKSKQLMVNFYYQQLNMQYVTSNTECKNENVETIQYRRPSSKSVYKELSIESEPVEDAMQSYIESHRKTELDLDSKFAYNKRATPFYALSLRNLRMIFVYGDDYQRQATSITLGHLSIHGYFWPMYLLSLLLAIALYVLPRRANVPETGLCASLVEVWSVGIAGGAIRCRNRGERVLFAITMISSFFVVSVILAKFSMQSTTDDRFEKIDTFEELSKRPRVLISYSSIYSLSFIGIFRNKLPRTELFLRVTSELIEKSHVLIVPEQFLENYKQILSKNERDFDVIEDSLGAEEVHFSLRSYSYISQQTIDKFHRVTNALMESGLYEFYSSMAKFWFQTEHASDSADQEDEERAITLYEFRFPLILCGGCLLFTLTVFVSEVIWFHLRGKCRQLGKQCKQFVSKRVWKHQT